MASAAKKLKVDTAVIGKTKKLGNKQGKKGRITKAYKVKGKQRFDVLWEEVCVFLSIMAKNCSCSIFRMTPRVQR